MSATKTEQDQMNKPRDGQKGQGQDQKGDQRRQEQGSNPGQNPNNPQKGHNQAPQRPDQQQK